MTMKVHETGVCDACRWHDACLQPISCRLRGVAAQQAKAIIDRILSTRPFERLVGLENRRNAATFQLTRMAASIPSLPVVT
jgi:hypothetical protein